MTAVLDASDTWGPMYDWRDERGDEGVLAHPAIVRAISDARIKMDKIGSAPRWRSFWVQLIVSLVIPPR